MGAFITLVAAIVIWLFVIAMGPSQAEINQACVGRGGVLSYSDHTWGATTGTGTVVCGNKIAYEIN